MKKPDVTVPDTEPPAELVIIDEVVGDGAEASSGDDVSVHYVAMRGDGKQFDASWDRKEPSASASAPDR